MNRTGGRYYEDPKTGVVTRAEPQTDAPAPAEPAPPVSEPSTDPETVASKAGKKG
ncbi:MULTISPECIES: hypothetical protein [Labrys]|uniref:Uncharacterized protein n=1 Tax=Labrys neptuniae TaxID=376174 RepID=A0ABV3PHA8_9HYPH|nr:hypothetical protein [Labrys sp. WJW]